MLVVSAGGDAYLLLKPQVLNRESQAPKEFLLWFCSKSVPNEVVVEVQKSQTFVLSFAVSVGVDAPPFAIPDFK